MPLSRRMFLRAGGIALGLPALDAMLPVTLRAARAAAAAAPKRMVTICTNLGIHTPYLFPTTTGPDYAPTPYLELLKDHRKEFTVFSGMSHPEQAGANGHSSEMTWLTAVRNPGLSGFRNAISLDQFAAEKFGYETRYPSLVLSSTGTSSQSFTRSGVSIPAEYSPAKVFAKLFLDGKAAEIEAQSEQLRQGRSILDAVADESKRLERRVGPADKDKLDEYFTSVREMELRISKSQEWVRRPKPKVDAQQPTDSKVDADLINRIKLILELVPLALQTDSTRVIAVTVQGRGDVPLVPGVSVDHHGLSHHGQDPEKLAQLKLVESEMFKGLNVLLSSLKSKREGAGSVLDNTSVLFGSNLGNANAHDSRNLPIVFAGGGFKHAGHVAYDPKNNKPFSNLFVSMLQRMGIETDKFGTSTGTLSEI
ncbi:MAG: DUF1552 domain-containing protein [Planctomycetia bacterium]|nr:DUF1552 domain-containing protein [Planctomycetia bacterium]